MTKRQITALVSASYINNKLDSKRVEKIATLLSRADLKLYVRGLKLAEKAMTISLVLPDAKLYNSNKKIWEDKFKNKKIVVQEDPSLLMGVKIVDNDMVYDMSLKNNFETFAKKVTE